MNFSDLSHLFRGNLKLYTYKVIILVRSKIESINRLIKCEKNSNSYIRFINKKASKNFNFIKIYLIKSKNIKKKTF